MSRDPLEGVRPSDSERPTFSYTPPPTSEPIVSPGASSPVSSGRAPRGKVLLWAYVGALCAALVGGFAYYMTIPHPGIQPKPAPSVTTEPSPQAEPSAKAETSDELVVHQGSTPPSDPVPAPTPAH